MKTTRKNFNAGPGRAYAIGAVTHTLLAIGAIMALPAVWRPLEALLGSDAARRILTVCPPEFEEIHLPAAVAIAALAATAWLVGCARHYSQFHDGTWQGGEGRVADATHGEAWLESRPLAIRRRMPLWRRGLPCEPGLVVGSLGGAEVVRPFVNAVLYGAPGSGKTRRVLLPTAAELMASGRASIIMLDPKGEIRDFTTGFAHEEGMEVFDIRLDDPERSMRYDLLRPARRAAEAGDLGLAIAHLRELAATLIPDLGGSGGPNQYFSDAARSTFLGLALWLLTCDEVPPVQKHMGSILSLLKPEGGRSAAERVMALAESLPADHPASSALSSISGSNSGSDGVISNLVTALNDACDERVSRMLHDGEVDFAELGRRPGICYISFATDTGSYGRLTTAIVSQALSALRGEARESSGALPVPVYFLLEEAGQLWPIRRMVSDAGIMRAEGIHLLFVLQDRHQLEAKGYSKAEVEALLGMADDTIVLKLNDVETATMLSRRLGSYTVRTRAQSSTRGIGGGSSGTSYQIAKRDLISPSELTEWSADTGLLLIGGEGSYAIPCPDLSKRFVNDLLGMGDREHNRRLRIEARASSESRNLEGPTSWTGGEAATGSSETPAGEVISFDPFA